MGPQGNAFASGSGSRQSFRTGSEFDFGFEDTGETTSNDTEDITMAEVSTAAFQFGRIGWASQSTQTSSLRADGLLKQTRKWQRSKSSTGIYHGEAESPGHSCVIPSTRAIIDLSPLPALDTKLGVRRPAARSLSFTSAEDTENFQRRPSQRHSSSTFLIPNHLLDATSRLKDLDAPTLVPEKKRRVNSALYNEAADHANIIPTARKENSVQEKRVFGKTLSAPKERDSRMAKTKTGVPLGTTVHHSLPDLNSMDVDNSARPLQERHPIIVDADVSMMVDEEQIIADVSMQINEHEVQPLRRVPAEKKARVSATIFDRRTIKQSTSFLKSAPEKLSQHSTSKLHGLLQNPVSAKVEPAIKPESGLKPPPQVKQSMINYGSTSILPVGVGNAPSLPKGKAKPALGMLRRVPSNTTMASTALPKTKPKAAPTAFKPAPKSGGGANKPFKVPTMSQVQVKIEPRPLPKKPAAGDDSFDFDDSLDDELLASCAMFDDPSPSPSGFYTPSSSVASSSHHSRIPGLNL